MKNKKSFAAKRVERRLALERWERRLGEKIRRKQRKVGAARFARPLISAQPRESKRSVGRKASRWLDLTVPAVLDLDSDYEVTCKLVADIKNALRRGRNVRLRFDDVQRIRISALTLLLAQTHKLRLDLGDHRLTGTYPVRPSIERLLSESGFYNLLNVKSRVPVLAPSKTVRYISFRTDQKINGAEIARLARR